MVQEEEEEHVYEGEYEGSDRVVLGVVSTVGDKDEKDDEGEGRNQTDEMNAVEEHRRRRRRRLGGRRRTMPRAPTAGRYDLDLDILEMIYGRSVRPHWTAQPQQVAWLARMHSWLLNGLAERVRAGFKPLPPKTIIQTNAGPVWPEDCLCQPRRASARRPPHCRGAAAVTSSQRALPEERATPHERSDGTAVDGLSLGQAPELHHCRFAPQHGRRDRSAASTPHGARRGIQSASSITLREEESRLESAVVRAPAARAEVNVSRTVGLRPADHNQTHPWRPTRVSPWPVWPADPAGGASAPDLSIRPDR